MNNELSFIYEPKEMEENFEMDKSSKEIQQLLKQKNCILAMSDI